LITHEMRRSVCARLWRAGVVGLVAALFVTGCADPSPEPPDPDDIADPHAPDYLDFTIDSGIWAAMEKTASTMPNYLYAVRPVDGAVPHEVTRHADVAFKTTPQRTLRLDVYTPDTPSDTPRRAMVLYSGGGFLTDLDFSVTSAYAEYFASRGFVTFAARHRLLTEDDVDVENVLSDALAAVRFVVAEGAAYGADPERISVLGHSSGGQLALLVGMLADPELLREPGDPDAPVQVAAIIDIFGPTDFTAMGTDEDASAIPVADVWMVMGGTPEQKPELYALLSPIEHVRPGLPPTMIVHGGLDSTIPIAYSVSLADALEEAGNTVYRAFDLGAGHVWGWGLGSNDGFGRAAVQIVRFLEQQT
jgi:acetyl esterase/lipase